MLAELVKYSVLRRSRGVPDYRRFLFDRIDFNAKLIGIIGARGAGKTTLVLQYLESLGLSSEEALYISCDHPLVGAHTLFEIAEEAAKHGVKTLVIDEIHKKENFSVDLKNIYDFFDIQILFTGSSAIHLEQSRTDLSRRALLYRLPELSFREYVELTSGERFPSRKLEEILHDHVAIAEEILHRLKPIPLFKKYLKHGAYPYFTEGIESYPQRLVEIVRETLRDDIALLYNVKLQHITALQKILEILCQSEPFEIHYEKVAAAAEISKNTLKQYLYYLEEASLTRRIGGKARGARYIAKPDKLYLHNTNLFEILCSNASPGTLRETFFAMALGYRHRLSYPPKGDFFVDERFVFEIGGEKKGFKQIETLSDAYIAADNIEVGYGKKIPLWLFGFLY
jgi:predicted AAA+ superfamily ATPase